SLFARLVVSQFTISWRWRVSVSMGYSAEEIRALVQEYEDQPFGTKREWLRAQPFSEGKFRRWRMTVIRGDLDRGLVPREGGSMAKSADRHFSAQAERARQIRDQQAQLERMQARIDELEAANDALGKAIGLLHAMREHEPDMQETTGPTRTDS
ncbi:hypothetical protein, partial [Demequina silvatica]|uniref:hypothetical protein n=1 Tax=Demequina silvatica TaxID=1638988 RepID=UPI000B2F6BFB